MFDQFSYGYLGFTLGPDGRTLYYLTGGPIYENGRRVTGRSSTAKGESKGAENLHLVTYDIPARALHGPRAGALRRAAAGRATSTRSRSDATAPSTRSRASRAADGYRVDLISIKP